MRSSFGKTFGIEEPQTDLHVTTHSTINVESISHEAPTDTKDEIYIEPPTKIKCKSNLNYNTDEILHEIENESQLIDEHFLEEPVSIDVNLADPTESCDRVHDMLNGLLQTLHNGRILVDRDFKEDFLTGTEKLLMEIEYKVHDMLPIINDVFVQHEKDLRDIVLRGKCPDDARNLFISGDPAGRRDINLTDQHREYLLSKEPQRLMLDSYPVKPSIPARKQNCFTKSWYNINPFIEYSRNLDKILFYVLETGCSKDMSQNEGLNRWDKMKGGGRKKRKDRNTFYEQCSQAKYSKVSFIFKEIISCRC